MPAITDRTRSTAPCGCRATATSTRTSRRTPSRRPRASSASRSARTRSSPASTCATAAVRAVETENGAIECETVVNAAGMWAPRVAAMVGAFACSIPVDHQHIALHAVEGHELPHDMPCFRDTDNLVYGKAESGGVMFGGYEPNPVSRWEDGVPWEHGARTLPADHERFEQLMAGAVRRFPLLDDAGVTALVCHPDAMTPDGNPLLGPMPGVEGFWTAAGLSLNGFGGAGGLGKALAELVTVRRGRGRRPAVPAVALRRPVPRRAVRRRGRARGLQVLLPAEVPAATCPRRAGRSGCRPLHARNEALGAVFGTKNGWERADWYAPGEPARRAGEEQRAAAAGCRPPWHDRRRGRARRDPRARRDHRHDVLREARARRSSTCSSACAARASTGRSARSCTRSSSTSAARIVGDVTVTRLADDRFRVVTGAGAVDSDRGFLELHGARVTDVTDDWAVIGLWGPAVREARSEDFPFRHREGRSTSAACPCSPSG